MREIGPPDEGQHGAGAQQTVDAGVGNLPGARGLQGLTGGGAVQAIQHTAMRDQRHRLTGMVRRDFVRHANAAFEEVLQDFTAGWAEGRVAPAPTLGCLGLIALDLGEGAAFE